jgi:AcrR family transcriptional regulator
MTATLMHMPRENHREQLLQGAMRCLREKGYAHTTARDIAAAANSNLGSIGYHFGSKEALLNEAIREGFAEWTAQVGRIAFANAGATPLERGRASWVALTDTFKEHRSLMVAFVEALAQAERSNELRRQLADIYEGGRAVIGDMIAASFQAAKIDDPHTRAVASLLIAICDGLMLQWLVDPEHAPSGRELIAGLEATLPLVLAEEAIQR